MVVAVRSSDPINSSSDFDQINSVNNMDQHTQSSYRKISWSLEVARLVV